jgi:hypothetical protein
MSKDKYYYKDGTVSDAWDKMKVLHRVSGPAIEYADGDREWYINDKRHRIGGPAVEFGSGHRVWYVNNRLHRTDGPAVEYADGGREWWIDGVIYNKRDFKKMIKETNKMSLAMRLTDPRWWVRELGEREVG